MSLTGGRHEYGGRLVELYCLWYALNATSAVVGNVFGRTWGVDGLLADETIHI